MKKIYKPPTKSKIPKLQPVDLRSKYASLLAEDRSLVMPYHFFHLAQAMSSLDLHLKLFSERRLPLLFDRLAQAVEAATQKLFGMTQFK